MLQDRRMPAFARHDCSAIALAGDRMRVSGAHNNWNNNVNLQQAGD
jgi:hypothetical protein